MRECGQRMLPFAVVAVLISGLFGLIGVPARTGALTWQRDEFSFLQSGVTAPTDVQCRAQQGTPCYSPQEMRQAYGLTRLIQAGYTGRGQSIVIIDSFGSPTIASDLRTFDASYGLPDPPSFKVLAPLGSVAFDPSNQEMVTWAFESTMDVEWAHAIAPGAGIVLLTSPVAETEGVQGLPEFLTLERYALDHHLGKIFSQSWGVAENTLFTPAGEQVIANFESFYQRAANEGVSVFASAGDTGSANQDTNNAFYPYPVVSYPASSPWVTAVGGSSLYADTSGNYQSEAVWDNQTGAGGGGVSQYFKIPAYQQQTLPASVLKQLQGHRGIPDVSYNADADTAILVYLSFIPGYAGFYRGGGTSEGAPQWAAIIAIANQLSGHELGFLNKFLYILGRSSLSGRLFHDISVGNNSFAGVSGYTATPGWDLASGWGTPKLAYPGVNPFTFA